MPSKAGEALLNHGRATYRTMWIGADMENLVLAIEAEAVTAALDALAKEVRGMPESLAPAIVGWGPLAGAVDRAAVLAAIKNAKAYREDTE